MANLQSEVNQEEVLEETVVTAEQQSEPKQATTVDSPVETIESDGTIDALSELEEALKTLTADEVIKFQRELSAEMGENLFEGEVGEVFKKYHPEKPRRANAVMEFEQNKVTSHESKVTAEQKEGDTFKNDLLKAKVELELVKNGVNGEFLEEATIVALSKIKDTSELSKAKDVSAKFIGLKHTPNPVPQRTSIAVGDKDKDLTDGEKAVAFLKGLNPKGFK